MLIWQGMSRSAGRAASNASVAKGILGKMGPAAAGGGPSGDERCREGRWSVI